MLPCIVRNTISEYRTLINECVIEVKKVWIACNYNMIYMLTLLQKCLTTIMHIYECRRVHIYWHACFLFYCSRKTVVWLICDQSADAPTILALGEVTQRLTYVCITGMLQISMWFLWLLTNIRSLIWQQNVHVLVCVLLLLILQLMVLPFPHIMSPLLGILDWC